MNSLEDKNRLKLNVSDKIYDMMSKKSSNFSEYPDSDSSDADENIWQDKLQEKFNFDDICYQKVDSDEEED